MACCRLAAVLNSRDITFNDSLQGYQLTVRFVRSDRNCVSTYTTISLGFYKDGFFYRIGYISNTQLEQEVSFLITLDDFRDMGFNESFDNQVNLVIKALCRDDNLEYDYAAGGVTFKARGGSAALTPNCSSILIDQVYPPTWFRIHLERQEEIYTIIRYYCNPTNNQRCPQKVDLTYIVLFTDGSSITKNATKNVESDTQGIWDEYINHPDIASKYIERIIVLPTYTCGKRVYPGAKIELFPGETDCCRSLRAVLQCPYADINEIHFTFRFESFLIEDCDFQLVKATIYILNNHNDPIELAVDQEDVTSRIVSLKGFNTFKLKWSDFPKHMNPSCRTYFRIAVQVICRGKQETIISLPAFPLERSESISSERTDLRGFYLTQVANITPTSFFTPNYLSAVFETDAFIVGSTHYRGIFNPIITFQGYFYNRSMDITSPSDETNEMGDNFTTPANFTEELNYITVNSFPYHKHAINFYPGAVDPQKNIAYTKTYYDRLLVNSKSNGSVLAIFLSWQTCDRQTKTSQPIGVRYRSLTKDLLVPPAYKNYAYCVLLTDFQTQNIGNNVVRLNFSCNISINAEPQRNSNSGILYKDYGSGALQAQNFYVYQALVQRTIHAGVASFDILLATHIVPPSFTMLNGNETMYLYNYFETDPNMVDYLKVVYRYRRLFLYTEIRQFNERPRDTGVAITDKPFLYGLEIYPDVSLNPNFCAYMNMPLVLIRE